MNDAVIATEKKKMTRGRQAVLKNGRGSQRFNLFIDTPKYIIFI
jgi:hypothetical protein